jgi:hypothetical protein
MLRKVALNTWRRGCACAPSSKEPIQACADWFNKNYGATHPCGPGQTDWIQAACDLPEYVMTHALQQPQPPKTGRSIRSKQAINHPQTSESAHAKNNPKSAQQAAESLQKREKLRAMNQSPQQGRKRLYLSQIHQNDAAITFKERCDTRWNIGWACWDHGQVDLKVNGAYQANRYLIGEIADAGGDFLTEPGYTEESAPETHCCSGSQYQGGVPFGSVQAAIRYLKQYFDIIACPNNRGLNGHPTCNQRWIDAQ